MPKNGDVLLKKFIRRAPEWKKDGKCGICFVKFGPLRRDRHHCRRCGISVCENHSNTKLYLPEFPSNEKVRVCWVCFDENEENKAKEASGNKTNDANGNKPKERLSLSDKKQQLQEPPLAIVESNNISVNSRLWDDLNRRLLSTEAELIKLKKKYKTAKHSLKQSSLQLEMESNNNRRKMLELQSISDSYLEKLGVLEEEIKELRLHSSNFGTGNNFSQHNKLYATEWDMVNNEDDYRECSSIDYYCHDLEHHERITTARENGLDKTYTSQKVTGSSKNKRTTLSGRSKFANQGYHNFDASSIHLSFNGRNYYECL